MSEKKSIYSFAQSKESKNGKHKFWYAYNDGIRISCKEELIHTLWMKWCYAETAHRADDNEFTIFAVNKDVLYLN